jgi:WD40 repeat protein
MSRVVRSSKFRHVFGAPAKKENTYDGIKPSRSAWDSNKVAASSKFIGVIWDAAGGGAFAVLDADKRGKLGQFPLVTGHSGEVLDIEFSPFNDNIVASVSDDGYAKLWKIPEGGLTESMNTPVQSLQGHRRKVGTLNFNPIANNVLATTSADYSVRIWDVETGETTHDIPGHVDIIQSATWNYTGEIFATACKDKNVRVMDPRANSIIATVEAHPGVKGMRCLYLGNKDKLFTMGFSKTSERQFSLFDPRKLGESVRTENIDTASGIIMPFFDNDTSVLFLAGKGDGNIRYYEVVDEAPYIHFLTEYKSATPQRGMGWTPKLAIDLSSCEIARMLKLTATAVEPVSFSVPRKSDIFQDDLYPPTFSGEPTLSAKEWNSGKNGEPKLTQLKPGFEAPKQKDADFKTVVVEKKERSAKDLQDENDKQAKRIAYLEAEVAKLTAKISQLEGGN